MNSSVFMPWLRLSQAGGLAEASSVRYTPPSVPTHRTFGSRGDSAMVTISEGAYQGIELQSAATVVSGVA